MRQKTKLASVLHFLLGTTAILYSLPGVPAPYGTAGCGLGSLIFTPNTCQISAATTNGSFLNQPFGITFGTSNCVGGGSKSLIGQIQSQFMADNYATLSKEIAQGDGETLRTLSQMLGCNEAAFKSVATTLQGSYTTIFSSPGSVATLHSIKQSLLTHPGISSQCADLAHS